MLMALGFILILVASVLEAFCTFGRQARPDVKPGILKTPVRWVLETLWALMMLGGGVALLISPLSWIGALVAVIGFWLILPFMITPILRYRLLPHWDEVKTELIPKGYNEKSYWRGDWWMSPDKQKPKKAKKPL
jgi:4-hydroxybenzoate polyprenyltransferase